MKYRASIDRLRKVDPKVFDALLTAALTVVGVGSVVVAAPVEGSDFRDPDVLAVVLSLVTTLPLYWRRRAPLPALLVSTVALSTLSIAQYQTESLAIPLLFLVYAVSAYAPRRDALIGLAAVETALVLIFVTETPDLDAGGMLFNLALFAAFWLAGQVMRARAEEAEARFAQAEEQAEAQLQQAARSVAEERLRLAQELHDVMAHSMSVIAVQAGMGVHVIDEQPDEAKRALTSISRTSRTTLQEMRRLLGVLRDEGGERAHLPAPEIGDLTTLVADVCAAGVDATLSIDGNPDRVPHSVQMSVFRIVQESLTNVLKHAGQAAAVITVDCGDESVGICVSDDGRGAAAPDTVGGHGLTGMRERVAIWGGELAAGPRPGGGFEVSASLPFGSIE